MYRALVVLLVPFLSYAEKAHLEIKGFLDSGSSCRVQDVKVIDQVSHGQKLCTLYTRCESSDSIEFRILPCQATEGDSECPNLDTCIERALRKEDTSIAGRGKFEKFERSIRTDKEGVCELTDRNPEAPGLLAVKGIKDSKSVWDTFCVVSTKCETSSRYMTVCKPTDRTSKEVVNGKTYNLPVCPSFSDCYSKEIVPRKPITQYTSRTSGTVQTASGHR